MSSSNLVDYPDICRDKIVNITLQGGQSYVGLRMTDFHTMIGCLEFTDSSTIMAGIFIRISYIAAIEVWK